MKLLSRERTVFIAEKIITHEGKTYKPGETLDVDWNNGNELAGVLDLFYQGKVSPNIPKSAAYEAVRDFSLRSDSGEMAHIKCGEIITLGKDHALELMRKQSIVPVDEGIWCPIRKKTEKEKKPWLPSEEEPKKNWVTSWEKKPKNQHPIGSIEKDKKNV